LAKPEKKKKEEPPVDAAEGEGTAPPKKKLPMLYIIIAAAVLVVGGGGTGAYFMFLAPKPPAGAEAAKPKAEKKDKKKDEKSADAKVDPKTQPTTAPGPDGITYLTLPDTIANIQSPDGQKSFLKLKLTFECPDDDAVDAITENMPRVNDMLQGFLSELRPDDLSGSGGDMQLRLEILRRINLVIAPHKVNAVLIESKILT